MSSLNRYRFRSVWHVRASVHEAYAVLRELTEYPRWWPEVKRATRLGDDAVALVCRSVLPYDLSFVAERGKEDRRAGLLEAKLSGDLEGVSRWTITGGSEASMLVFEEEVVTNKRLLNRLTPLARPAFIANHSLMMRNGERGLRTYLAGFRRGRRG